MPRKGAFFRAVLVIVGLTVGLGCEASGRDAQGPNDRDAGECHIAAAPQSNARVCFEVCTSDSECIVAGRNLGYTCQGGRCLRDECDTDEECMRDRGGFTAWAPEPTLDDPQRRALCTADRDAEGNCPDGGVCCWNLGTTLNRTVCLSNGWCAAAAPELPERCEDEPPRPLVEERRPDIDGVEARICVHPSYHCASCDNTAPGGGQCHAPCLQNADCGQGWVCGQGRCVCDDDEDCHLQGGACEQGRCVCADVLDCGRSFDGTELHCGVQ